MHGPHYTWGRKARLCETGPCPCFSHSRGAAYPAAARSSWTLLQLSGAWSLSFSSQRPRLTEQAPVQAQLCAPQEPGCMSEGGGVASLLSGTQ